MKIVILTGAELRHTFMRKAIALDENIEVLQSYCEGTEKSLIKSIQTKEANTRQLEHLQAREESEEDFFASFIALTPDNSMPRFIKKGSINNKVYVDEIIAMDPDLLIVYGSSIIKAPLVSHFSGRFINVHLGLSPYYRGSGTNFWPLVNREPEYVGATFMYIDQGVDTGEIIHQIRARVFRGDTPHQIGNRLITDVAKVYIGLINCFPWLKVMEQPKNKIEGKYYTNSDFTSESVDALYHAFSEGLVDDYLHLKEKAPIIVNPVLEEILR